MKLHMVTLGWLHLAELWFMQNEPPIDWECVPAMVTGLGELTSFLSRVAGLPKHEGWVKLGGMKLATDRADGAWRKSRLAARLLIRRESRPLRSREQALALRLSRDAEGSNRLIQQAVYFPGFGPQKHALDQKLVGRRN
jgi:hypothetical protein